MNERDFLRKQMLRKTREQIEEKFAGKEIHIIKAVNLLRDLESITNLLGENLVEWSERNPTTSAKEHYLELEKNLQNLREQRTKLVEFIEKEMSEEFPSFSQLATPIIGAKLLSEAGSKKKLSFMPSSTIQVLGAEKALFNHLKQRTTPPKHGHLFNHPLLQNLPKHKRGKMARTLAGKLSLALKQDYFSKENNSDSLQKELEKKSIQISNLPQSKKKESKPNLIEEKKWIDKRSSNPTSFQTKKYFSNENKPYSHRTNRFNPKNTNYTNQNNYSNEKNFSNENKPYSHRTNRFGPKNTNYTNQNTHSNKTNFSNKNNYPSYKTKKFTFNNNDYTNQNTHSNKNFSNENKPYSHRTNRFGPKNTNYTNQNNYSNEKNFSNKNNYSSNKTKKFVPTNKNFKKNNLINNKPHNKQKFKPKNKSVKRKEKRY